MPEKKSNASAKTVAFLLNNEAEFCCFLQNRKNFHSFPQHLYFEPTNACNLRCCMCPRQAMTRPVSTMATAHFNRIIDELVELKAYPRLTITGSGEPLLDKRLLDKVRYAKDKDFHVSIITNATILTEARSRAIIGSGLDRIQFSFDSIRKKVYDQIRIPAVQHINSYFDATLANIKLFLRLNREAGHPVYTSVASVQMDLNRSNAVAFTEFWNKLGVDNVFLPEVNVRAGRGGEKKISTSTIRATCILPFNELNIMSNGEVPPCGPTKELASAGNAFKVSLEKIWFGRKFKEVRALILAQDGAGLEKRQILCRQCNAWQGGLSFEDYFQHFKKRNRKIIEYILA